MKRLFYIGMITLLAIPAMAGKVSFGKGTLNVRQIACNAVRIQYYEQPIEQRLPEWLYVKDEEVKSKDITVDVDASRQRVVIRNKKGEEVFSATAHQMRGSEATLSFNSPQDEHLYGLGRSTPKSVSPCFCRARAMVCCGTTTEWWSSIRAVSA